MAVSLLASCADNSSKSYTVTWDLDNGSEPIKETYKEGEVPSYKGETPSKELKITEQEKKEGKDECVYTFKDWDKKFTPVNSDVTYRAMYDKRSLVSKISFKMDTIDVGTVVRFNFAYLVDEQDIFVNWGDHTYSKHDEATIEDPGIYHIEHEYTNKIRKDFSILIYGSIASLSRPSAFGVPSTLELSNTITIIDSTAFSSIEGLTSITISSSVKIIKEFAFVEGMDLSEVFFEKDSQLETIGDYAFASSALTSIIIPKSVKTMAANSFSGCHNLSSVIFEEGIQLETISNGAFASTALTSIIIPESVKTIGDGAFYGSALTSIIIPKSVETIASGTFSNCQFLSSIVFEENTQLRTFSGGIFSDSALTSIIIPKSVNEIQDGAFSGCSNLSSVIFEEDIQLETIAGSAFDSCTTLTSIIIPKSTKTIDEMAFSECTALSSVIFEEDSQLETIAGWSFEICDLTSIKIPNSTKTIGDCAFDENYNLSVVDLTEFTIPDIGKIPSVKSNAFPDNSSLKFYVANDEMLNTFTNESSPWYPYASKFTTDSVPTLINVR